MRFPVSNDTSCQHHSSSTGHRCARPGFVRIGTQNIEDVSMFFCTAHITLQRVEMAIDYGYVLDDRGVA